ncbi:MAG TPA: hypothetical protein VLZ81_01380 [Blastocatellia bacterium]|nr:hypothetical protein [Blastocatellia bacterium]
MRVIHVALDIRATTVAADILGMLRSTGAVQKDDWAVMLALMKVVGGADGGVPL